MVQQTVGDMLALLVGFLLGCYGLWVSCKTIAYPSLYPPLPYLETCNMETVLMPCFFRPRCCHGCCAGLTSKIPLHGVCLQWLKSSGCARELAPLTELSGLLYGKASCRLNFCIPGLDKWVSLTAHTVCPLAALGKSAKMLDLSITPVGLRHPMRHSFCGPGTAASPILHMQRKK